MDEEAEMKREEKNLSLVIGHLPIATLMRNDQ
jgi:hypothetical protein